MTSLVLGLELGLGLVQRLGLGLGLGGRGQCGLLVFVSWTLPT